MVKCYWLSKSRHRIDFIRKVFGCREFVELADPEMLHERWAGSVQNRSAHRLRFPKNLDQPLVQKLLDGIVAIDAAYVFRLGFRNGLLISNDRESFHRRSRQPLFGLLLQHNPDTGLVSRLC